MSRKKEPPIKPQFRVGDRVSFQFVFEHLTGVVVEDRGLSGREGGICTGWKRPSGKASW